MARDADSPPRLDAASSLDTPAGKKIPVDAFAPLPA
jgi:hypothetical protein